tara:strand:+ start:145 stop:777 length:633 start_codon:yes stop_codon:yes gene_type:complete
LRIIESQDLGVIEHENADSLMKEYQQMRINDKIPDTLLICEHPEIVTIGPRAKNDGIRPPVDYHSTYVDRGGGLTWHGPGQIVVYPIFKWNLEGESNVKSIINMIEEWVIQSLNSMGVESRRDDRMQGVWIGDNKICSIGLSFLRWTSRHGFTINYDTPDGRVEMVSGCGLGADTTTSLSKLGFDLTKEQIIQSLFSNINIVNRELASQD